MLGASCFNPTEQNKVLRNCSTDPSFSLLTSTVHRAGQLQSDSGDLPAPGVMRAGLAVKHAKRVDTIVLEC